MGSGAREKKECVISESNEVVFQRWEGSVGSDANEKSDEDRKLTFSFVKM